MTPPEKSDFVSGKYWDGIWAFHNRRRENKVWPILNGDGKLSVNMEGNKNENKFHLTITEFLEMLSNGHFASRGTIRMGSNVEKTPSLRSIKDHIKLGYCSTEVREVWLRSENSLFKAAIEAHQGLKKAKGDPSDKEKFDGPGFVYALKLPRFPEYVKVGYTADLERRLSIFQVGFPEQIKFLLHVPTQHPKEAEALIHSQMRKHVKGEWFEANQGDNLGQLFEDCITELEKAAP